MLKFRSMRTDAEKLSGPVLATENDPRVTRVGRLLRKTRLDELPQFINVLRGDMSIVGPRPERPELAEQLAMAIPYFEERMRDVKPGITGLAQIFSGYADSVDGSRLKLEYDRRYLAHVSLALDVRLLAKTVKVVLTGHGSR